MNQKSSANGKKVMRQGGDRRAQSQPNHAPKPKRKPFADSRTMAWIALNREQRGVHIEDLLDQIFAEANPSQQERSFAVELANGVTRWRLRLDHIISYLLADPTRAIPKDLRNLIRLGLYQIFFLDRIPAHAAVDLTVEMTKANQGSHISGFVNAILRRAIRERDSIPLPDAKTQPVQHLSVVYSHPQWLVERWLSRYGFEAVTALCKWDNRPPVVYLKANLRKTSAEAVLLDLAQGKIETGEAKGAHIPLVRPGRIGNLAAIREGRAYVQDPSSGLVVELLGIKENERVTDLCSAPGGKAAGIAEKIGNGVLVTADLNFDRLQVVKENLRKLGENPFLCVMDGQASALRNRAFDAILLDAPCSNTGVLSRRSESRWQKSPQDISRLSALQSVMLSSAASLVKPGGRLVYSTCSLEPEEDQLVVEAFLRNNPQFVLEPARLFVPAEYDNSGFLQIQPWVHHMDGIFAARLKRVR